MGVKSVMLSRGWRASPIISVGDLKHLGGTDIELSIGARACTYHTDIVDHPTPKRFQAAFEQESRALAGKTQAVPLAEPSHNYQRKDMHLMFIC